MSQIKIGIKLMRSPSGINDRSTPFYFVLKHIVLSINHGNFPIFANVTYFFMEVNDRQEAAELSRPILTDYLVDRFKKGYKIVRWEYDPHNKTNNLSLVLSFKIWNLMFYHWHSFEEVNLIFELFCQNLTWDVYINYV